MNRRGVLVLLGVACIACSGGASGAVADGSERSDAADVTVEADVGPVDAREDPRVEEVGLEADGVDALTACPQELWESSGRPCATQLSCEAEPVTCCGEQFVTLGCSCDAGQSFNCWIVDPVECLPGGCQPNHCHSDDDCPEGFTCGLVPGTCPDCVYACLVLQPACTLEATDVVTGSCPVLQALFPDLDWATFQPFPPIGDADLADIHPGTAVTYWEERYCFQEHDCTVLRSHGTKCGQATDPDACKLAFDALSADDGFAKDCQGSADCYSYLAVNRGDETFVVADEGGLASFLAPIDTLAEVACLGYAAAYSWGSPDAPSGIREVVDGWEFLAKKRHNPCNPVTVDGYLLHAGFDGQLTTLCRQLQEVSCGACL